LQISSDESLQYDHAGCKELQNFTVAAEMFDIFDKKEMCDSVFTGQESASKN